MKKSLISAILASCALLQGAEEDYLIYIWQVNTWFDDNGVKQVIEKKLADLPQKGTKEAAEGIMGTSEFFLYAEDVTTGEDHLLDTTSASAYKNDATLTIEGPAADAYNLNLRAGEIPRTQVGQGFTLQYTVNGLLEDNPSASEEAAKQLDLFREVYKFDSKQTKPNKKKPPTLSFKGKIEKNGHHSAKLNTAVPSANATKTRGLERFVIASKDGYKTKGAIIADAEIFVWPISDGSFSGLKNGETYRQVPTVGVSLVDLYPTSDSYLEISSSVLDEPIIYGSRKNTNDEPISVDYNLTSLNEALEKDGTYTIRLLHVNPFETLEFDSVVIHIDRKLKLKGGLSTSEK